MLFYSKNLQVIIISNCVVIMGIISYDLMSIRILLIIINIVFGFRFLCHLSINSYVFMFQVLFIKSLDLFIDCIKEDDASIVVSNATTILKEDFGRIFCRISRE